MSNSGSPLLFDADLTDYFLMALPDFQSLQAFILSSMFVYSVFRRQQNSILSAVACNQFGLALPQAMRLVGYIDSAHSLGLAHEGRRETGPKDSNFAITSSRVRCLRDHATIVRTLEDVYSWREKEPRFRRSRLSAIESLRFQQSVYRFWLLAAAYGPGAPEEKRKGLGYTTSGHLRLKDSIVLEQTAYLTSLGEAELAGVREVYRFLLDLAKWALLKHTAQQTRLHLGFGAGDDVYLVWGGPAVTLDAFRGKWSSYGPIDSQWYGIWHAMSHIISMKDIAVAGGRVVPTIRERFILDGYFLKTINCGQCQGLFSLSEGNSLWSFCNWEYMLLAIGPSRLGSFLSFEKGRPLELLVSFTEVVKSIPYPQIIEEIFDVRSAQYKDWNKDDWLCTHCMTMLLSDNIHAWLDKRMRYNY